MFLLPNNSKIETDQIKAALDDYNLDTHYFLNLQNGQVELVSQWADGNFQEKMKAFGADSQMVAIPRLEPAEKHKSMRNFTRDVVHDQDPTLCEKLFDLLQGRKSFRRFKEALYENETVLKAWYQWHDEYLHKEMTHWFEKLDISITEH